MTTGKELFADKNITLADGKNYKLEFSFQSLMELEDKKDQNIEAVFAMFETDFNTKNMMLALWGCLLTHHEEEFGHLTDEEIKNTMKKLINAECFLAVKLTCVESFAAFFKKAKESKQLPEQYRKALEEMEAKQNKKK
jgi:hypothetical protein